MDKLVIAAVQDQDTGILIEEVTEASFRVTKLSFSGGFLGSSNTTLLTGVQGDQVEDLPEIMEKSCKAREVAASLSTMTMPGEPYAPYSVNVTVGGATASILDVDQYVRYRETKMRTILAIVPGTLIDQLMGRCLEKKIQSTRVASPGGLLKQGSTTVILGIEGGRLDQLKKIFEDLSQDLGGDGEGTHVFYMAGGIGREF